MTLGELITFIEDEIAVNDVDPDSVLPVAFNNPHSYRGYYDEIAFEPTENIKVGDLLNIVKSALGATYHGWKGGDFTMNESTNVWLAEMGTTGESIGPTLMRLMFDRIEY